VTDFSFNQVQKGDWQNEHGTFLRKNIRRFMPIASPAGGLERWRAIGSALKESIGHAFSSDQPLRVDGGRWSLSKIGLPQKLALSLAAHDVLERVPASWLGTAYSARLAAEELTPMLVSSSMKIERINRLLTMANLALRTSGASNGQTFAGATSTGTHGAAIGFGAMHDMIVAVHVMVAPNRAVLVQPANRPLKAQARASLEHWLGVPTELVSDDAVFEAVRVGLGSMGVIVGYVIEVEPLYFLTQTVTSHTADAEWKNVLATRSAASLGNHSQSPFNLAVLLSVYKQHPAARPRAWVSTCTKTRFSGQPGVEIDPSHPLRPNPDTIGLLANLGSLLGSTVANPLFRAAMTGELVKQQGEGVVVRRALPGVLFGPTALPRGQGHSVELVVDAAQALVAVETLLAKIKAEFDQGRQLLGAMSVRFVGGSSATLAPNTKSPTAFIEIPSIRTTETTLVYDACSAALSAANIPFGCHWGQYLTRVEESLSDYWPAGNRAAWLAARRTLLPSAKARRVFASPVLAEVGLDA